tara:strand:+ start:400 stop:597 length:198 start_codon:yes stop_codon:yes gene_type:complete
MKKENKILAINKPIQELTEFEVDEIIEELVKNGSLEIDKNGRILFWSNLEESEIKGEVRDDPDFK